MSDNNLRVFTPAKLGPIQLRNRTIRSAAFEGMCPQGKPSDSLLYYHQSVAEGSIGMTTIAYASVTPTGRSFEHQMWMREEIVPDLRRITDAIHAEGAAASIQLGHCGNMSDKAVTKTRPLAPSAKFNLFGLARPKGMTEQDIAEVIEAFGRSVELASKAGFDAVEIHAGHGYLISQFLSPHTNRRRDRFGGSLENRTRFLVEIARRAKQAAADKLALIFKMNLRDGFDGGMELQEAIEVAKTLEREGADALVLSGGFVSKCPMYIMRGDVPLKEMITAQKELVRKVGLAAFGRFVVKAYPFREAYFLEDALVVREAVSLPLIFVGGLVTLEKIEEVLERGFDFVAMARALIREPDFVKKLETGETRVSKCEPCNKCMATMYYGEATCPER